MYLFTHILCVYVAIGKRKRGFGERWSLEEMKRPWDCILRCGGGAKGGRLTTVGEESSSVSFCCRGGPAPFLGLDRLVGIPEHAQSLPEPETYPSSLSYPHTHAHISLLGVLSGSCECPETWHSFLLLLPTQVQESAPLVYLDTQGM